MNGYLNYISYFETLASSHPDINGFVRGNWEDVLNMQRSGIKYPVLFVEDPEFDVEGVDYSDKDSFECAFVIASHAQLDDREKEASLLDLMYVIVKSLILQIKEDQNDNQWHLTTSFRVQRVHHATADNLWGWYVSFSIQNEFDICTEVEYTHVGVTCELAKASIIRKDTDGNCWKEELSPDGIPIRTKID